MPWDQAFWSDFLNEIQANLASWLPSVLSALLLLFVGWLVARLSQALLGRLLQRLGLDRLAERSGIARGLANLGIQSTLSTLLARITYWLILIFFILLALGVLGLTDVVAATLDRFFAFLPRLVTTTIILIAGTFLARVIGDAVTALTMQSNIPSGQVLGQAVRYSLLLVIVILALDELGVQTTILTTIVIAVIGCVALGLALAFGLGNRDIAYSIMAGFHAREEFTPGQMLSVGEYSGRLLRIGATKTVIETSDGQISLPNIALLTEAVKIQPSEETTSAETRVTDESLDEAGK